MDKYLQYNHLELSEDPSFIKWAKGSEAHDGQDWDGWLVNHPDKADLVAKSKSIVLAMKFVEDKADEGVEDKVWNSITTSINEEDKVQESKPKQGVLRRLLPFAAVAAVALIFLIFSLGNDYDTSINVPYASIKNITLPDGSTVSVNADSKLAYNKESWDKKRTVFLEGEAFFEVEKGSKFKVLTNDGIVQVLGTSFNVYSRNDQLSVQCETGKVSVQTSGGMESILMPQQSTTIINGNHEVGDVTEVDRRSTWRNGIFVYSAARIIDVAAELERQFDVKITMDASLNETKYTGSFDKSNFETALIEVLYPLNLKFEIDGNNVTITK